MTTFPSTFLLKIFSYIEPAFVKYGLRGGLTLFYGLRGGLTLFYGLRGGLTLPSKKQNWQI